MIVFMSTLRSNPIFYSLSLTIQLDKNICQVINYKFIKTIKIEPTSGKSSICNQSRLSKDREHLKRHQF